MKYFQLELDIEDGRKWIKFSRDMNGQKDIDIYNSLNIETLRKENIIDDRLDDILKKRLIDKRTYKSIGMDYNLGTERIRQLYVIGIGCIKKYLFIKGNHKITCKKECIDIVRDALNNMDGYCLKNDFTDWCEGSSMLIYYIADKYMQISKDKNKIIYGQFKGEPHFWNVINDEIYDATIDQFGDYNIYDVSLYINYYEKELISIFDANLMKNEQNWIDKILKQKSH